MDAKTDDSLTPLEHLSKEELVQHIKGLEEQPRMNQAFLNSPDIEPLDAEDATLYWRGGKKEFASNSMRNSNSSVKASMMFSP